MTIDSANTIRLVRSKSSESEGYLRQLHIWLGVGCAGGAIAIVSLAAKLPNPSVAVDFFWLSLCSFLVGAIAAGASLFLLSRRAGALAAHFAASHNSEQIGAVIKSIPEIIASPPELATRANARRNQWIERYEKERSCSEREWSIYRAYSVGWGMTLAISASAFVFGSGWPLAKIGLWGSKFLG